MKRAKISVIGAGNVGATCAHWCAAGVSVGSETLFDDDGPFGTGLVTAIANPAAQIDFGGADVMPTLRV